MRSPCSPESHPAANQPECRRRTVVGTCLPQPFLPGAGAYAFPLVPGKSPETLWVHTHLRNSHGIPSVRECFSSNHLPPLSVSEAEIPARSAFIPLWVSEIGSWHNQLMLYGIKGFLLPWTMLRVLSWKFLLVVPSIPNRPRPEARNAPAFTSEITSVSLQHCKSPRASLL